MFPTEKYVDANYVDKPFQHQILWHTKVKPELAKEFPLINLPYIKDKTENAQIAGEWPCLIYLAEKYGYFGENLAEKGAVHSLCDVLKDFRHSWLPVAWTSKKGDVTDDAKNRLIPKFLHFAFVQRV